MILLCTRSYTHIFGSHLFHSSPKHAMVADKARSLRDKCETLLADHQRQNQASQFGISVLLLRAPTLAALLWNFVIVPRLIATHSHRRQIAKNIQTPMKYFEDLTSLGSLLGLPLVGNPHPYCPHTHAHTHTNARVWGKTDSNELCSMDE